MFSRYRRSRWSCGGLGLAITKVTVDAHEGKLSLRDRQPNGLIVQIDLPIEGR